MTQYCSDPVLKHRRQMQMNLRFPMVPGVIVWKNWAAYDIQISLWAVEQSSAGKWVWEPVWFLALVFIENLGI